MKNCPICDNDQFQKRRLTSNISIEICNRCGFLISQISRTEPIKAEFSYVNDNSYQESVGRVRRIQALEIVQTVKQFVEPEKFWLDVGCSFGYLLADAKRNGFTVMGVEPDEKAAKIARSLLGEEAVQHGLFTEKTIPDGSQDVVSMLDVLEHIPANELSGIASLIHTKLMPNGLWVIKVPTTEGLFFSIAHFFLRFSGSILSGIIDRLWQSKYEYPHTLYFNLSTLKRFLESHGYDVIDHRYLAEVPNNTIINRMSIDNSISRPQAIASIPVFYLINFIERIRGKSDALLVLARRNALNDKVSPPI